MLGGDGTAAAVDATLATTMEGRRSSNSWLLDEMVSAITHTCSATTPSWRPMREQSIFRRCGALKVPFLESGWWVVVHVHEMKNHRPPAHVYVCVCGFVFGNRRAGIIGNWLRIRKVVPVPTQVS